MIPIDAVSSPAVIELRQYTLRPGRREELIELFDREFIETQEETGMLVLGQFRDLDEPDRFVWLRGFEDMAVRHRALTAFYDGPVWAEHGPQASATMADSDDVLLLRPLTAGSGFTVRPSHRPRPGAPAPEGFVSATVWSFPPGQPEGIALIRHGLLPALHETGPAPLAALTTETAHNTFARLPVRTGENAAVVFTCYPDESAHRRHMAEMRTHPRTREILTSIGREQTAVPRTLRLAPTSRSLLP
ncbi:NIPSNAP family protein [Streptomyces rhizosphaericus]|uniref:NIPSNAP family protein n=1 Tax=Streptomyces rhizosphaericus TaxID=114699 RepID=A0A6G4A9J2_9ACTN|nr:NIPSNAP family protein [Streptomyces rhizosphaericus]NEW70023.1 NIPSNAP family protein [Streptomyces rhizosphaericus]